MTALIEQEFRLKSDEALESARRALMPLADSDGAMTRSYKLS
jgi:hypothetical protein